MNIKFYRLCWRRAKDAQLQLSKHYFYLPVYLAKRNTARQVEQTTFPSGKQIVRSHNPGRDVEKERREKKRRDMVDPVFVPLTFW